MTKIQLHVLHMNLTFLLKYCANVGSGQFVVNGMYSYDSVCISCIVTLWKKNTPQRRHYQFNIIILLYFQNNRQTVHSYGTSVLILKENM